MRWASATSENRNVFSRVHREGHLTETARIFPAGSAIPLRPQFPLRLLLRGDRPICDIEVGHLGEVTAIPGDNSAAVQKGDSSNTQVL